MTDQRRHEAQDVGQMMERMFRALVTRAAEGDTIALEQLAYLEGLSGRATSLALRLAHEEAGYTWGELAKHTGQSRQACQQRASRFLLDGLGHVLRPGHNRRTCVRCHGVLAGVEA